MVLPTRGTGKGTPHLLGLVGGGVVCLQRHRPMWGATGNAWFLLKWSSSPRMCQWSQSDSPLPVEGQHLPAQGCPGWGIPRMGEFYEYYLLMNKSIKSVFETCKVAFLEMPMIILQTLNISVPVKSKIKYSPEGQEI